jgi:hypothetical protein
MSCLESHVVFITVCIMLLQVTIVDRDEREEQNLITRRNTALRDHQILHGLNGITLCNCYFQLNSLIMP